MTLCLIPVDNASTNDLGEYRVFSLPPGRYFLSASRSGIRGRAVKDADQSTYIATYYPSGSNPAMAAPIEVAPGSVLRGMDIRMQKTRAVQITGRVTGANAGGRGGTNIMLVARDGDPGARNTTRPYSGQGDFILTGVAPGSYLLIASQFDDNRVLSARVPLEVGNSNIEGITLDPAPGAELHGSLKIEGPVAADIKAFRVTLAPRTPRIGMGGGPGGQGGTLGAGNTFTLSNVQPELYDVRVNGVPDGGYIKSIRFGNADITDAALDLTVGVTAAELAITVSMTAGAVGGSVVNESTPAASAVVVLVPEGARREIDRYYAVSGTDDTGRFTLKNIAPGEYRVFAFDNIENGAYMDPDWLKPFESKGEKFSVKDNEHATVQLKLIVTQGS